MTNGGGPHGKKPAKKAAKKSKPKAARTALQRKGWVASAPEKGKVG